MALFRKLFYRKPPDGLLEICERVYVFDCCFTTNVLEEDNFKVYMHGIVGQLRDHFPDASFLVFNFHEANAASLLSNILSEYDMTIMDYPRQFQGCPVLPMEMLHHFLRSCESWLSLGQQNLLLMHCQRGAWPVLAFMLGALLIYRKQYRGEQKTLEMIYKQAPCELLHSLSPVNPVPSQLRYLQYVSRRNVATEWPPSDRGLNLECVIIRFIPNFDGEGGCRPMFRIYGPDPLLVSDKSPKVLYSTPKRSKFIRAYKQAECGLVKIDINCHIQGDVVVECISLSEDMEQEKLMFRVMFNTAFIRSNILMLNRDEIDMLWNAKDQFPKEFRSEILLSDMDTAASVAEVNFPSFEEKDGLPVEAFSQVQEMFSHVDWSDPNSDAALYALHQFGSPKFNTALQERYSLLSPKNMKTTPTKHMPKNVQESMDSPSVQSSKRSPRADVSNDNKPQTLQISPTSSSPCGSSGEATPLKVSAFAQAVSWVYDTLEARSGPNSPSTPSRTSPSGLSCTSAAESLSSEPTQLSFTSAAESLSSDPSQCLSRKESDIDSIDGFKSLDSSPPAVASSAPPFPVPPTSEKASSTPPSPDPVVASSTPTPAKTPRTSPPVPTTEPSTLSFTPPLDATGSSIQPRPSPLTPPAPPPPPPALPSAEVSVSRVGSHPSPPQPSSKAPPVKEVIGRVGQYPPPLPPPPPTVTLKEVSSVSGGAPPPPPPPLNSKQAASPNPSSGPPPLPPPAPSGKGVSKTNSGAPPPPYIAPPNGHLSRMMNSKNNQGKKLKPLHWLKLTRAVQGSLWAEAQKKAAKAPEIDISELETLFSAAMPNADKEKGAQRAKQAPKSEKVQLVDHRRAYNCEIMLSKVKVPLHELMGSVLTLEDSALDEDHVDNLIKFCPTKEEMEQLKGYTGDQGKLGKCEQFFLELMKVPRVESKLRVFSFKIQFKSQVSDLKSSLSVINSVTEEIRSSAKLRSIMQTILTLGNALNQGTARGSAVGFRLDSLLKLTDTRSIRNSKMTLMHYLCKVLSEKLPELLDFSNGIASLESAARIQLKFLAEEMQAISKGLEKVVQELSLSESDGPVSETFRKILKEFLCYAEAEVRSLAALYSGVGRNVDALILYFGEDPARCPFEQVIATLLNFVRTFNRAHKENCKQRELELKKAQKAEAEKAKSPRDSQRVLQTQLQTNNVKSAKLVGDNTVDFVAYERRKSSVMQLNATALVKYSLEYLYCKYSSKTKKLWPFNFNSILC